MFCLSKSAVTTKGSTHPICSDWLGVCEVDLPTSTSSIERDWSLVWLTTYENALSVVECTVLPLVAIHTSRSIMLSLYVFFLLVCIASDEANTIPERVERDVMEVNMAESKAKHCVENKTTGFVSHAHRFSDHQEYFGE